MNSLSSYYIHTWIWFIKSLLFTTLVVVVVYCKEKWNFKSCFKWHDMRHYSTTAHRTPHRTGSFTCHKAERRFIYSQIISTSGPSVDFLPHIIILRIILREVSVNFEKYLLQLNIFLIINPANIGTMWHFVIFINILNIQKKCTQVKINEEFQNDEILH